MSIKLDGLADALATALEDYRQEVFDDVKDSVKKTSRVCVKTLKSTSPKLTGHYKNGWKVKTAYEDPYDIRVQVYNKTDYQLTHLLEKGHANINGGRTPAHPHIKPAAEEASKFLAKDVQLRIKK